MKTFKRIALAIIITATAFTSCKKSKKAGPVGTLGPNYPYLLNNIISPPIIDSLKKHGMEINEGLTPPTANGIYLLSPDICTFDDSGANQAGEDLGDELFKFSNQNTGTFTIDFAYRSSDNSETGSANNATFISGNLNSFTIYAQAQDTTDGVNVVALEIVSGQISNGGIVGMQFAGYVKSKGSDPNDYVVPVGTTRVVKDDDGFSEALSTFSINPQKVQSIGSSLPKSLFSVLARHRRWLKN